jgi:hypothetical protein
VVKFLGDWIFRNHDQLVFGVLTSYGPAYRSCHYIFADAARNLENYFHAVQRLASVLLFYDFIYPAQVR